jgi:dephospho-CoA kinase
MLRVGLTGGIATGKSTVAAILRELGCNLLAADKIAHGLSRRRIVNLQQSSAPNRMPLPWSRPLC